MSTTTTVLFSTFPPFPTLSLRLPSETCVNDLYHILSDHYPDLPSPDAVYISPHSGSLIPGTPLSDLHRDLVTLRIVPRLRGGKGGFGSQLRAAGGRMSSQKTSNNDSCRDLTGRRLSTIKTAKRLVDYMENEEGRKKAAAEAKKAKLENLEKKIASSSTGTEQSAGKKHRLDDTNFLEESQDIIDNVRSAVSAGLLKKKKKAKINPSSGSLESSDTPSGQNDKAPAVPIPPKVEITAPITVITSA